MMSESPRLALSRAVDLSWFETLERRTLLCAGVDHDGDGLPDEGLVVEHIPLSKYQQLSPEEQATYNPHQIEDDRPLEEQMAHDPNWRNPIVVTTPTDPSLSSGENLNPGEVAAYPDFIPRFSTNPYISTTYQPGRVLVRFGTLVGNQGLAPAYITGGPVNTNGTQQVLQYQYAYNPTTNTLRELSERYLAGNFTYHAGHGHIHYDGYASYELRYRNTDGSVGALVTRADGSEAIGEKVGYCLIVINNSFTMTNGQSSTTLPTYNQQVRSTSCGNFQGIPVGRADIYSDGLEGQWLDVTGVPNGQYYVTMTLNPNQDLLESDYANNSISQLITINATPSGSQIPIDRFDDLATGGPNNSIGTATRLGEMGIQNISGMTIHAGYDEDFYEFTATSTGTYSIVASWSGSSGSSSNIDLFLYNKSGGEIARATSPNSTSSSSVISESLSFNFVKGQTYFLKISSYNERQVPSYGLQFNIKPTVDTGINTRTVLEGETRYLRIERNGPAVDSVTVPLTWGGSALRGVDYNAPTSVILDVESHVVYVPIETLIDSIGEGNETITLTINSAAAFVAGRSTQMLTIVDRPVTRGLPMPLSGNEPVRLPFSSTPINDEVLGDSRVTKLALLA